MAASRPGGHPRTRRRPRQDLSRRMKPFRAASMWPRFRWVQSHITSTVFRSPCPGPVRVYSTFGGTVGYTVRSTSPLRSSMRRFWVSILWLIPSTAFRSSLKRSVRSPRASMIRSAHLLATSEKISRASESARLRSACCSGEPLNCLVTFGFPCHLKVLSSTSALTLLRFPSNHKRARDGPPGRTARRRTAWPSP